MFCSKILLKIVTCIQDYSTSQYSHSLCL